MRVGAGVVAMVVIVLSLAADAAADRLVNEIILDVLDERLVVRPAWRRELGWIVEETLAPYRRLGDGHRRRARDDAAHAIAIIFHGAGTWEDERFEHAARVFERWLTAWCESVRGSTASAREASAQRRGSNPSRVRKRAQGAGPKRALGLGVLTRPRT